MPKGSSTRSGPTTVRKSGSSTRSGPVAHGSTTKRGVGSHKGGRKSRY